MCEAHACEICFDMLESTEDSALFSQLCGNQCKAQICRQCLTSHVRVSLYVGDVPKVRCPIGLEPMNKR